MLFRSARHVVGPLLRHVGVSQLGQAAVVSSYARQLGGVVGIAVVAVFVQWRESVHGTSAAGLQTAYSQGFLLLADQDPGGHRSLGPLSERERPDVERNFLGLTVGYVWDELRDTDGTLITLDPSAYVLAAASDYSARLVPAYGTTWPATRAMPEAVRIAFVTGYADAASVPELIKAWIKLRLGALYEHRQAWTSGTKAAIERNPFVDRLLDRYVVPTC